MNAVTILDVLLGLAFVYLVFSAICSTIVEWMSAIGARRAHLLERGIDQLLGGQRAALAQQFHQHPLITGLRAANGFPNYMPSSTFAQVFIHLTMDALRNGGLTTLVAKPALASAQALVESLIVGADSFGEVEARVQKWFDGGMERVSGWYKRWTQVWMILLASAVVFACDVDTIRIARELNRNGALRSAMAQRATEVSKEDTQAFMVDLGKFDIDLGRRGSSWSAERLLGLFISVLAVSLGAPFWFELLNRLVNLRQTGLKPGTTAGKVVGQ